MSKATTVLRPHVKRYLAAMFAALVLVALAFTGFSLWTAHWRPLPQGTPKLSPEVEALRDRASSYVMQRPGHWGTEEGVKWVLVVTFVSEKNVAVNFTRSESGDVRESYDNEPYTLIPVGSSADVLG